MAYQDWFSGRADQNIADAMKAVGAPSTTPFGSAKPFAPNDQPFFAQDPYAAGNSFVSKSPIAEAAASKFGERSAGSYEAKVKNQYSGLEQQSFGAGLNLNALSFSDAMNGLDARSRIGSTAAPQLSNWSRPYGSEGGYSPNGMFGGSKGGYSQRGAFWALDNERNPEDLANGGGSYGGTGAVRSGVIGQFDAQAAAEINAAAAKWGVPAPFLMTIIAQESSGDWTRNNRTHPLRGETLLPYVGIFESTARSRGLNYQAMIGNRALQIDGLAQVLKSQYDQIRKQNPAYDWINVASYHFSGRPVADGWSDEAGKSNNWYINQTKQFWGALQPGFNPKGGVTGGGSAVGVDGKPYSGLGIDAIVRGNDRVSQGFGPNSFSMGPGAWMYGYAKGLGMTGHPGVDYSMRSGTPLYIPTAGTVIYGGGTSSFQDYGKRAVGSGELRIQTDNGHLIIFGHMNSIPWRPGQRVTPGQMAGLSGGMNGDHLHLEVRVPGRTSTGWQAVDPRSYFGGLSVQYSGGGETPGGTGAAPQQQSGKWWEW